MTDKPEIISTLPAVVSRPELPVAVAPVLTREDHERIFQNRLSSLADSTRLRYQAELKKFDKWCVKRDASPLPAHPQTIELYAEVFRAKGASTSGLNIAMAAIRWYHNARELPSPFDNPGLRITLQGIRAELKRPPRKVAPLELEALILVLGAMNYELAQVGDVWIPASTKAIDVRDRAMLLLGFSGALRRSEIASLRSKDIHRKKRGLYLDLENTKTGRGELQHVAIRYGKSATTCPARVLEAWLFLLEQQHTLGPEDRIFRNVDRWGNISAHNMEDEVVAEVVKRRVDAAGLDPEKYSGHSLRAGFATTAGEQGRTIGQIILVTRHKSRETALGYIRAREDFKNEATDLGL